MPADQRRSLLVPISAALIVGAVLADTGRRIRARPSETPSRVERAPDTGSTVAGGAAAPASRRDESRIRRAVVRERITTAGAVTYVGAMLAETDSILRRWGDERADQPLRVVVSRSSDAVGYGDELARHVTWAIARWNGVGLPMSLLAATDSATADIVVVWTARLDGNRTGRTDILWDRSGRIRKATVVLATHAPDGQPLDARALTASALHELGHALGLGHSDAPTDALYPITRAVELTERDRSSARLLYRLPPGSVRD